MAQVDKTPEGKENTLVCRSPRPVGRAPSNLAEPLPESLSHRPGPGAQPEAEQQLRRARLAAGGLFLPCNTSTVRPLEDVRRWGQQRLLVAAPRCGGLQGSRGQPPAGTGQG